MKLPGERSNAACQQAPGRVTVGKTACGCKDRKPDRQKVVKLDTPRHYRARRYRHRACRGPQRRVAYKGMPFHHESVRHSVGPYVDGMAQNGRVVLEHAQARTQGRLPKIGPKHLNGMLTNLQVPRARHS